MKVRKMADFVFSSEYIFPVEIRTSRLKFSRITYDTASIEQMYELHSEVPSHTTRFVTWSPHENRKQTKEYIDNSIDKFESGESAGYIITRKDDEQDAILGTTGFSPSWEQSIAESGIFLFEDYWGNGYGTERGEAMLELAFEEFDFDYWMSKCDPDNEASIGAIKNYVVDNGGREVGVLPNQVKLDDEYNDILYFIISRESYLE
jgi:RimJ/RimL family protein N-acetyltransferase